MGRRTNINKDEKKEARNAKKLERKQSTKKELARIILACEGSVTEKNYFQSIFSELIKKHGIAKTSLVIAKHQHTDPLGVLQDLQNELSKDNEFEHKWIVIDRDEMRPNGGGHPLQNFNGAISSAQSQKINVAYSNPSFEIWYLLHYEYRNTGLDRDDVIKELEKYFAYSKNSKTIFDAILSKQDTAIANAKRLKSTYELGSNQCVAATDNPMTTVYQLVELLRSFQ